MLRRQAIHRFVLELSAGVSDELARAYHRSHEITCRHGATMLRSNLRGKQPWCINRE